jgi:hypothetical protein
LVRSPRASGATITRIIRAATTATPAVTNWFATTSSTAEKANAGRMASALMARTRRLSRSRSAPRSIATNSTAANMPRAKLSALVRKLLVKTAAQFGPQFSNMKSVVPAWANTTGMKDRPTSPTISSKAGASAASTSGLRLTRLRSANRIAPNSGSEA